MNNWDRAVGDIAYSILLPVLGVIADERTIADLVLVFDKGLIRAGAMHLDHIGLRLLVTEHEEQISRAVVAQQGENSQRNRCDQRKGG